MQYLNKLKLQIKNFMQLLNKIQKIALYLFFFSINFEMMQLFPQNETFSLSKLAAILYFLTVIPQYNFYLRTDNIKRFLVPAFLFFIFETVMNLFNINETASAFFDSTLLLNILFFWLIINHERKEHLVVEKAMLSFALGAVALTLFFLAGIGVDYEGGRVSMFGDDQNYIGFRMVVAIFILVFAALQNRLKMGWSRLLLLIPIPFMLNLIFATGSRGAFLSFVTTFVIAIILYKTKDLWKKLVAVFIGLVVLLFIGLALLESPTMKSRLEDSAETGNTAGRTEIWQNVIQIIKKNPIFGIGKTGYEYETTMIYGEYTSPHNVILEILCYTGIIGLIIYFTFLYQIGMSSYFIYKQRSLLLPILLLFPVLGMILSIQILTKKFGWIIFAYIVSTLAIKHNSVILKK